MKTTFDPAKNIDLYFRKGRNGTKVFSFFNVAGDDYNLTDSFELRTPFDIAIIILDNTITFSIDEDANIWRDSYFWELVNVTTGKTWLCGTAYFTDSLSAEATDIEDITINLTGEVVEITINDSGSGSSVNHFRGSHDLSTEAYPATGGTGTGGIPAIGNEWYGINNGEFDVFGLGTIELTRGATLLYIGGTVTDASSWIVKQ